jgi:DNA repair protein RecN (Recombination protein N)
VAACADQHYVVAKGTGAQGETTSRVAAVHGEARVAEVARMLGGERLGGTSLAHAQAMLAQGVRQATAKATAPATAAPTAPATAATTPSAPSPAPRRRSKA